MDFSAVSDKERKEFAELLFTSLSTRDELKDWVRLFLNLEIPEDSVDPESTSSPLDAIWQIYNTFKNNTGDKNPGYILMSCREGMKTVSVSILEILLLLHFQLDIGHAAAVETQAAVNLQYIEGFMLSLLPLLKFAGWTSVTENKRLIKFKTPQGKFPFIKIVICNPKGMNSLHSNVLFLDELDLADPRALKEGQNITGYSKGIHGVTVYLSTRKYAFGNMAQAIERAADMNYKILRWNIMDVTERCPETRHLPDLPKEDLYVAKSLPLRQISPAEFDILPDTEKTKWDLIKDAHAGCKNCPLLPVCRKRLSEKKGNSSDGFFKPINSVIQKFKENDVDIAEAQLMCFGPTTQILMVDGTSKDIQEVKIGDIVITHTGNTSKVVEVMKRQHSGKVLTVENVNWKHFSPTIVTTEHPYFVNGKEFKSISDIKISEFDKWGGDKAIGDYLSFPSSYIKNEINEIKFSDMVEKNIEERNGLVRIDGSTGRFIPKKYKLDRNFGWMIGYFLAEGYVSSRTYSKIKYLTSITFCSDVREEECHTRVRDFAMKCGLTTSELATKSGYGYTIDIYNSSLAELFFSICGRYSDKKKLHSSLINANLDFLEGVLEGFDAGDGTKRKKPYKELTTTSYSLATQLMLIAARLKLCPRLTQKPPAEGRKQAYLVHYINENYTQKQKRTRFKIENNYNLYRVDDLKVEHYEGPVYNIEVEKDHSYIANGVAVHNCWKPGSEGLVYPRFNSNLGENVISMKQAYETLVGPTARSFVSELDLLHELQKAQIPIYAGVDWGYTHDSVIITVAHMPNGEVWVLDCFAAPGLEFVDVLENAKGYRDKYGIQRWFCDTAMPSHLLSFNKNGMKSPKFTKDVFGGIESIRAKIVTATGKRLFRIIDTPNTRKVTSAIVRHRFRLDGQGNVTMEPDDERGVADICDALRYIGQNLFPVRGPYKPMSVMTEEEKLRGKANPTESEQMKEEIAKLIGPGEYKGGTGRKGGFFWDF